MTIDGHCDDCTGTNCLCPKVWSNSAPCHFLGGFQKLELHNIDSNQNGTIEKVHLKPESSKTISETSNTFLLDISLHNHMLKKMQTLGIGRKQ